MAAKAQIQAIAPAERGSSVIDLPFVLIFFLVLLWGIFNFGFVFAIQSALTSVAEQGAMAALQMQAASSQQSAISARQQAATNTVNALVQNQNSQFAILHLLHASSLTVTTTGATCAYNANLICFTTQVRYPYAQHPIMPPLIHFPLFGTLGVPQQLAGSATVQVDPANLLPGGASNGA